MQGWMARVLPFPDCVERVGGGGQADAGRREVKKVHTVVSAHHHVSSHLLSRV